MPKIWNHFTPRLSALDLEMVRAVPPGGNWKNIPSHIPSKRLEQIRQSYSAGLGSRSTYYGRLHPDRPAYTVNTYFSRPGNGCHIHYDYEGGQHRVISQREAARLQSFRDDFTFSGNRSEVNTQIGNAVPPLLSYQIALQVGEPGQFVDLFCGAGGLSLGFAWAGWNPLVANDIDESALATYRRNIHDCVIPGDIRTPAVFDALIERVGDAARGPFVLLGGPPCQGFSTAGNRRSMDDGRNLLFRQYKRALSTMRPDLFLFENVPGILNMQGGRVFQMIQEELEAEGYETHCWKLRSELFGVPQRRTRVILIGRAPGSPGVLPPPEVTSFSQHDLLLEDLPRGPSVRDALDDLPPLVPGEDGSDSGYASAPRTAYQRFVRGQLSPEELLSTAYRAANCD